MRSTTAREPPSRDGLANRASIKARSSRRKISNTRSAATYDKRAESAISDRLIRNIHTFGVSRTARETCNARTLGRRCVTFNGVGCWPTRLRGWSVAVVASEIRIRTSRWPLSSVDICPPGIACAVLQIADRHVVGQYRGRFRSGDYSMTSGAPTTASMRPRDVASLLEPSASGSAGHGIHQADYLHCS